MPCQCCDGLMVQERYVDLELGSAGYAISSWRCLNCGTIVDPVIAAHHHIGHKSEPDQMQRQRLKELLMVP